MIRDNSVTTKATGYGLEVGIRFPWGTTFRRDQEPKQRLILGSFPGE
jgi:hypothetical protein